MGNYGVAYPLVVLSIKILAYWLRKETSKISIVFEVACSYTHRFHLLYGVLFIWKSPLRYCVPLQKGTVLGDKFNDITRNGQ